MAVYDYKCKACGTEFEVEHPMSEHPEVNCPKCGSEAKRVFVPCPKCGSEAKRVFVPSGIVFSGSGFYNTDQKGKK